MDIKEIINRDFAETAPTRSRSGTEDGEVLQNSLNRSQIDKANTSSPAQPVSSEVKASPPAVSNPRSRSGSEVENDTENKEGDDVKKRYKNTYTFYNS
jgi:hypothetical protein